jgi:hypothetical protein
MFTVHRELHQRGIQRQYFSVNDRKPFVILASYPSRFIRGLRAAGVVNTGAEPTHPEGSKYNAKQIRRNPKQKDPPTYPTNVGVMCQALR